MSKTDQKLISGIVRVNRSKSEIIKNKFNAFLYFSEGATMNVPNLLRGLPLVSSGLPQGLYTQNVSLGLGNNDKWVVDNEGQ